MARSPKKLTLDEIEKEYPIHFMVWYNDYEGLKRMLDEGVTGEEVEQKDVRGRSPLMLAVTLGHLEAARLLMEKGANLNTVNEQGWNVVQEAVATGDPELVQSVLEWRDYQRYSTRVDGVPQLLHKLKEAPDFYVEMKWEFTSWVPLVSSMCPSDTYKVYKQGSKVRIDTTLLGFDHNKWHRGNTTFIFQGQEEEARMMEVDHDSRQVFCEEMRVIRNTDLQLLQPSQESVTARLTTPIVTTYVDTDKICFERNKSGVWGWRQDKMETVNGRECKVFGASNVELVTKTRSEHLSDQDKNKVKGSRSPLQFLLGIDETQHRPAQQEEYSHSGNPCQISPEEYFSEAVDLGQRDIGRPKETTTKIQKFKGTLWLSEDYPLSLPQQIVPIIDLMAISNSHFAKLKHFIEMQLPAGFPVKIEIPLFHVLNARITFGNIFGLDAPVEGVSTAAEQTGRLNCIVDDSCFQPPESYTFLGSESRRQTSNMEEDDDMLQYAIQQSLLQTGHDHDQVDIWEALQAQRPNTPNFSFLPENEEEKQLQRAIEASLSPSGSAEQLPEDGDLLQALAMSQEEERLRREQLEEDRRREEEMVREALRLSLEDH